MATPVAATSASGAAENSLRSRQIGKPKWGFQGSSLASLV